MSRYWLLFCGLYLTFLCGEGLIGKFVNIKSDITYFGMPFIATILAMLYILL